MNFARFGFDGRPGSPSTPVTREQWVANVRDALAEIAAGRLRKVVLSRTTVVEGSWSVPEVLDRLHGGVPFVFEENGETFLGCTPELLVYRSGLAVETEAVAGTIDAGLPNAAERLLASAKDRAEHQLVVDHLTQRLAPYCRALEVPAVPAIKEAGTVLHLHTPIRGTLRAPVHVQDLARALHPTPAVCGAPVDAARAWIASHEPPRGWYCGAVGCFDDEGNGEFRVAIRCALISKGRAVVYAGAGIVEGSDPDAEYAETELKQRGMLRALGAPA